MDNNNNNRMGASLSIVGRLSTLQSVHYRRFHCMAQEAGSHKNGTLIKSIQSPE